MTSRLLSRSSAAIDLWSSRHFQLRGQLGMNASHASTNRTATKEAHNLDDVSFVRKEVGAVLVELVDGVRRVARDERHGVGLHGEVYGRQAVSEPLPRVHRAARRVAVVEWLETA
jgi:hypothetical protein